MRKPQRDVIVVGSGIMGAVVARQLRSLSPTLDILMVDGGAAIGSVVGRHLHDSDEPEIRDRYNGKAASGVQSVYVGAKYDRSPLTDLRAGQGMFSLAAFGEGAGGMPAAGLAWNAGGMGVHWTGACPTPFGFEVPDYLAESWDADTAEAQRALRVTPLAFAPSGAGDKVLDVLANEFAADSAPGRNVQRMPMAAVPADGTVARVGPSLIFPPIASGGDPHFELRLGAICMRLVYEGGTVTGVVLRNVGDGAETTTHAGKVIVCADPLRTPQLLWASGIRRSAVGAYLNEHAFLSGRVGVDCARLGIAPSMLPSFDENEPFSNAYWLPHNGAAQPVHGQLMEMLNPVAEGSSELLYSIGASVYVPLETRADNRLEFGSELDAAGLPKFAVQFKYSAADRAAIANASALQARLCRRLGDYDPSRDSLLLEPGSSMHYTGTVRMGERDDGASVCDRDGKVWGFGNLYLAGGGVVPTAVAGNTTLLAAICAVRTARAMLEAVS